RSAFTYGTNDGRLAVGESITLVAVLSEVVSVTGTPILALNSGGTATYTSGSGSNRLTFTYVPGPGDSATDLSTRASGALNAGAMIRDAAGNAVNASSFDNLNPAGIVAVDGTAPSVATIVFANYSATLAYGAPMTLAVTFSEAVRVSGIPLLNLDNGDTARYVSGTGTNRLTFSYTPAATQNVEALKTALTGALSGSITDLAGNAVLASGFDNIRPYLVVGPGAFASIMDAITYAIPGDTIMLNPGTYAEQIIIDKPLTLLGPNAGKSGSATNRTTEARIAIPSTAAAGSPLVSIADGVNGVTLDGLQLDCPDTTLPRFHYLISASQTNNLTIRNNRMYGSEIPIYILGSTNASGLMIERNQINGGPNVNSSFNRGLYIRNTAGTIQDNTITNMSVGIQFMPQANPTASVIQRNTIAAALVGLYANVQSNGSAPVLWSQNVLSVAGNDRTGPRSQVNGAFSTPVVYRAIQVSNLGTAGAANPPQMIFRENIIDNARVAGRVYNSTEMEAIWLSASYGSGDAIFNANSFSGWTNAVSSLFPTTVDLSGNWWGSNAEATIAAGLASIATGELDFGPFLLSGTDSDPATIGFQSDFSALAVTPLGGQFGSSGRVQEAVDLVSPGGSLTLLPGAYGETAVRVNRANLSVNAAAGVSGVGFVLEAADSLTLSGAGDVTITGNAKANTLVANAGRNTFTGLAGADLFRFNASEAGIVSASAFDSITDYSGSAGDRLDLEGIPSIPTLVTGLDISAVTAEADAITGSISQGILGISGDVANLNTLEEWLSAARLMASAPLQTVAFGLAGDTYTFQENGSNDLLIRLQNVSGITALSNSGGSDSQVWIV
ncbi:MAG: nitrous oxide reductase family maturation protein NosD, partial [Cyanobium sp.]